MLFSKKTFFLYSDGNIFDIKCISFHFSYYILDILSQTLTNFDNWKKKTHIKKEEKERKVAPW